MVPLGVGLAVELIPEDVVAECRANARAIAEAPTSWVGAVIVLCFWLPPAALAVASVRLVQG